MISSDSDDAEDQVAPLNNLNLAGIYSSHLDTNDLIKANTTNFEDDDTAIFDYQPRAQSMALSTEPLTRTQTSGEKRTSSIMGIGELQERMVDKWR